MSFDKIFYKGKEIQRDDLSNLNVDDGTSVAYYQHIYKSNFMSDYRRHACMQWGHWCWRQAREYPLDAVKFLFKRLFHQR